jgi:hypothetical protein
MKAAQIRERLLRKTMLRTVHPEVRRKDLS